VRAAHRGGHLGEAQQVLHRTDVAAGLPLQGAGILPERRELSPENTLGGAGT
jgi:hypothetical protein